MTFLKFKRFQIFRNNFHLYKIKTLNQFLWIYNKPQLMIYQVFKKNITMKGCNSSLMIIVNLHLKRTIVRLYNRIKFLKISLMRIWDRFMTIKRETCKIFNKIHWHKNWEEQIQMNLNRLKNSNNNRISRINLMLHFMEIMKSKRKNLLVHQEWIITIIVKILYNSRGVHIIIQLGHHKRICLDFHNQSEIKIHFMMLHPQ